VEGRDRWRHPGKRLLGQVWTIGEHICTHLDVPAHFIASGRPSPEMRLGDLVAAIVVVLTVVGADRYGARRAAGGPAVADGRRRACAG
jgi:kynurenine formamidase